MEGEDALARTLLSVVQERGSCAKEILEPTDLVGLVLLARGAVGGPAVSGILQKFHSLRPISLIFLNL